jgi:hypothetical protein
VVAGEGFEPSKAMPAVLQRDVRVALTSPSFRSSQPSDTHSTRTTVGHPSGRPCGPQPADLLKATSDTTAGHCLRAIVAQGAFGIGRCLRRIVGHLSHCLGTRPRTASLTQDCDRRILRRFEWWHGACRDGFPLPVGPGEWANDRLHGAGLLSDCAVRSKPACSRCAGAGDLS